MKKQLKTNAAAQLISTAEVITTRERTALQEENKTALKTMAADFATGLTKAGVIKGNQSNLITNAFASVLLSRAELAARAGMSFGGKRDLYTVCGYPSILRTAELGVRYERQDIAKRVVDAYPRATWRTPPDIKEDDDEASDTPFEAGWKDVVKKTKIWNYLSRVDRLAGTGQYAVLLLGFNDGRPLNKEIKLAKELRGAQYAEGKRQLLYLQPYGELDSQIVLWEQDTNNPRYGLPVMYNVMVRMANNQSGFAQQVHWTRILHVAEDCLQSDVFGTPILKAVYNRLQDIETILGGSAEMFWRGGWPGLSLEADPTMDLSQSTDALQQETDNYVHGLSRVLRLQGIQAKQLSPNIAEPKGHIDPQVQMISAATGIPVRILTGSERAELASTQDDENWNSRVHERQTMHAEPNMVRPLVDRLLLAGVIPLPVSTDEDGDPAYHVDWPDLNALSAKDEANLALTRTQALSAYISGGVDSLIPPHHYLVDELGYDEEEADAVLKDAQQHVDAEEEANIAHASAAMAASQKAMGAGGVSGTGTGAGQPMQKPQQPGNKSPGGQRDAIGGGASQGQPGNGAGRGAAPQRRTRIAAPAPGPVPKKGKLDGDPGSGAKGFGGGKYASPKKGGMKQHEEDNTSTWQIVSHTGKFRRG